MNRVQQNDEKIQEPKWIRLPITPEVRSRAAHLWKTIDWDADDESLVVVNFEPSAEPSMHNLRPTSLRAVRVLGAAGAEIDLVEPDEVPCEFARVHLRIRLDIQMRGWSVIAVSAENDNPGFCYTIGLTEMNLPEFIVFGLDPRVGSNLLHRLASESAAGRAVAGDRIKGALRNRDDEDIDVALRDVPTDFAASFAVQAVNVYDGEARFVMAVYPDRENRLPWESGFDESCRSFQPEPWSKSL